MPHRTPAEQLWDELALPLDSVRVAESLLGLTPIAAKLMSGVILASCPEVDHLIDEMPNIIRSLAIATTASRERMKGEVRGPIIWSETMSARSASAGDPNLYVCASQRRAYDTPENRVLAQALKEIVAAAKLVDKQGLKRRNTEMASHIRYNAQLAVRYRDHRALNEIDKKPDARDVGRTRSGKRHATYEPALAVLKRAATPITAAHITALSDRRTEAQHAALVSAVALLRARGYDVPPLRAGDGIVAGGPIVYVHDLASPRTDLPPGLHVGDLLLDVPLTDTGATVPGDAALEALAARAGARWCAVLDAPDALEWAVDQAAQFPPLAVAAP